MSKKQEKTKIIISYPRRPGFILKAHNLQQQLATHFGLSAVLEEHVDDCFTVDLNGTIIYSNSIEDNTHIDHTKIISAVGEYKKPLAMSPKVPPEPDTSDDPDHQSWINSVCSGE
jgi:hypothetical protein